MENDVIKAGEEIKSLARFTGTQRTAFRKLLKKYRKWTGSGQLEIRFREEVLEDPKSFANLDLGPLLDDYSSTLQQIRHLYETKIQQRHDSLSPAGQGTVNGSSTIAQLQTAIDSGSKVDFDTAVATVPLAESGTFASYFVHPENVVELHILLLQHARHLSTNPRSDSATAPASTSPKADLPAQQAESNGSDYFAIEVDDPERLTKELSSLTVDDREHRPGSTPQKAKLCARWNNEEQRVRIFSSLRGGTGESVEIKRKYVGSFFDGKEEFPPRKDGSQEIDENALALRRELGSLSAVRPLYQFLSSRSRFVGTNNSHRSTTMATLDSGVTVQKVGRDARDGAASTFPFAILLVRIEGASNDGLIDTLDQSHLVSPLCYR